MREVTVKPGVVHQKESHFSWLRLASLWSPDLGEIAGVRDTQGTTPALIVAVFLALVGLVALGTVARRSVGL